ncbi:MAG TPA: MmgE/PrpD family protein [Candidatus Competibacteraceae bacterium]|nr:MmgE/PrpD family protein [Gammaproteobacteria bacterium]HPF58473.1 MmgE/PrpD family protein [Candidatus Competibacteraceae bacterium]HRY17522.1 MmgE/PrpD family protein [Candidatus Competibacteraceae bacterium]
MSETTLTQQLTELIMAKPVAAADLQQAALLTLDAMANAMAGRISEPGAILLRWAGATGVTDAERNAFLLGSLTHILETDDLHRASVVHPGCVVVPAAWAVAVREGIRGHAMLKAVLWGFEAVTRIGMAVGPSHYRIWHNTATCGPYGSAMAAAALLQLDSATAVHALGNAGTQSSGLWQFLEAGTMTKHLHAGRAAEAGVLAADLARFGFTGPPNILEGAKGWFTATCPDAEPEAVTRNPEAPWQLLQTSIKPWPSCRHTHPAIDAARELRHQVVAEAIEQVEVETYAAALDVCDRSLPQSDYEAKFSLQHCVAAALNREAIDFAAFTGTARAELAALRERVTLRLAEPYASAYPYAWGSAVTVITRGGERLTVRRTHAKGDPEIPLSPVELIAKARMLMNYGGVHEADRLIDAILALSDDSVLPPLPEMPVFLAVQQNFGV